MKNMECLKTMENDKKVIGIRLSSLIAEKNVTQKEVSEFLEVKPNIISYWCAGTRVPNTTQVIKLAKYFNVPTDYLLGLTDIKSTDTTVQDICEYTGLSEFTVDALHGVELGIFDNTDKLRVLIDEIRIDLK